MPDDQADVNLDELRVAWAENPNQADVLVRLVERMNAAFEARTLEDRRHDDEQLCRQWGGF